MKIKAYKKDAEYSYTLGVFETIELLKNHPEAVIKVIIHSSFTNQEVINLIRTLTDKEVIINDKLINKLSPKENCYVVGIFNKYQTTLDPNIDHLVLVNPMNMGNFGTIVRTALGFSFTSIAVIKPAIDIFDPKVIRSSMGSIFSMNIVYYDSLESYFSHFKDHKMISFMLQAKKTLQETKFKDEMVSLVFGNESSGLPIDCLNDDSIIIKHSQNIDSLNLPISIGIALFEIAKQKQN